MIRRNFEISNDDAEALLDRAYQRIDDDNMAWLYIDEEDPEVTQDVNGATFVKTWILVENK